MDVRIAFAFALIGCSSSKPKAIEDARKHEAARDASIATPTGPYHVTDGPNGDVQVTVEWHDVPTVARASSGRTTCGTPRAAAVAPTVLWGIPEVLVVLESDHGKALVDPDARVALDHCALAPRIVIAGTSLIVASGADAPTRLSITREGNVRELDKLAAATSRAIGLPVVGHEVAVPIEAGAVYLLANASDSETAWIVVPTEPYAGITDPTGHAVLRDVPTGTYGVVAWLPARAGQLARIARGQVAVTAGALGEVTLDLSPPASVRPAKQ